MPESARLDKAIRAAEPLLLPGLVREWPACSAWRGAEGLQRVGVLLQGQQLHVMWSSGGGRKWAASTPTRALQQLSCLRHAPLVAHEQYIRIHGLRYLCGPARRVAAGSTKASLNAGSYAFVYRPCVQAVQYMYCLQHVHVSRHVYLVCSTDVYADVFIQE